MKFFVDQGANVNARDNDGNTALTKAAEGGNLEIVEFLINKGLDVNAGSKTAKQCSSVLPNREILKS